MTILGITREYRTHLKYVFTWPKSTPEEVKHITWAVHCIYIRYRLALAVRIGAKAATRIANLVLDEEILKAS